MLLRKCGHGFDPEHGGPVGIKLENNNQMVAAVIDN
jgi:hypothetical protein